MQRWGLRRIILIAIALLAMRDRPEDLGLLPYGREAESANGNATASASASANGTANASESAIAKTQAPALAPLDALAFASRSPAFWVLVGSFFICGASTKGLVGTHLIPAGHDYGVSEVRAAGLLAMMGIFYIVGTTASGWLTDRFSSRHLLFAYYTLRGMSLLALPLTLAAGGSHGLGWFALFYGLDWVATVPPTVRLTSDTFGRENTGVIYGWTGASHHLGASMAAFGAGTIRTLFGDYRDASGSSACCASLPAFSSSPWVAAPSLSQRKFSEYL